MKSFRGRIISGVHALVNLFFLSQTAYILFKKYRNRADGEKTASINGNRHHPLPGPSCLTNIPYLSLLKITGPLISSPPQ